MIIFGTRSFVKTLAMLTLVCSHCHNPAAHRLVQRSRWFTLFFIPLIPLGVTRYTTCAFCGATLKVSKQDADQMVAAAHSGTTPAPVEPGTAAAPQQIATDQPYPPQP